MQFSLAAIDPIAFSLGPIDVRWYGILIATGIVLGFLVVQREAVKRGLHPDFMTDFLIWAVPISIVGARLYYVIFQWEYYQNDPGKIFRIWEGGLAIHGALIAAVITAIIYTRKHGVSFWKVADITAPGLLIGQILGRWGNFVNQEAHGDAVPDDWWGYSALPDWIVNQMTIDGVTYHPTFLYESVWNLVGLLLILFVLRRMNPERGVIFLFYIAWYSFGRFFIEGMRTDSLMASGLKAAQVVSIIGFFGAILIYLIRRFVMKIRTRYRE
ncbi:prolipoprotein diacylglyceryl transferase [Bhargavaea cecembensis]|uniref:Phosphatidylglycerol--prolipoprotein diacylglyceryl transferase n=1 Tax=Bhargavaea cecembensis TaxID=394098 RepID=A0A163EG73_9BACL|nr:prolipoprotein diacylglyceryl transferase [Bhargavaea cecembensis]KZE36427.1 prolipoprotein diacylglyceryl transferase [Bhargavaea cecembensis]